MGFYRDLYHPNLSNKEVGRAERVGLGLRKQRGRLSKTENKEKNKDFELETGLK